MVVDVTMFVDNQKNAEIGARMKEARESLGLTQDSFARAVGGSKRGIQENEARNRVPGGLDVWGALQRLTGSADAAASLSGLTDTDLEQLARLVMTFAAVAPISNGDKTPAKFTVCAAFSAKIKRGANFCPLTADPHITGLFGLSRHIPENPGL